MNELDYTISSTTFPNDFEVQFIIDGNLIWRDHIGVDPYELNKISNLLAPGIHTIARCECGSMGCDDFEICIEFDDCQTIWTIQESGEIYKFNNNEYETIIKRLRADTLWEPFNRKLERIIDEMVNSLAIDDEFKFSWSSTRIKDKTITLAFTNGISQKFLETDWCETNEESILMKIRILINNEFKI